jgi:LPS-assembly protein
MSKLYKITVKTGLALFATAYLLILTFCVRGANHHSAYFGASLTAWDTVPVKKADSLSLRKDSSKLLPTDTSGKRNDSLRATVDTLTMSKDSLDAPVRYHASDSGVLMMDSREFYLYGKAKTEYKDLKLEAATIEYKQGSNLVRAYGSTDSTGNPSSKPQLVQGDLQSISDTIVYNMNTAKARTINTFVQEGEIFVNAAVLKKVSPTVIYAKNARFTTCNLDTPHFAFRTTKMKMVKDKVGVTGRIYPEIEQIPIPMITLPYAMFPLSRGPQSGIMAPSFTASEDFGLGLENFGYYKILSEHADLTTRASLYSYGGWKLDFNSKYIKRYKYSGSFNLSFQKTKALNRSSGSEEEFNESKNFMVNWNYSKDNRARPGTNFSANVNFGSTQYNRNVLNNPFINYNNQLQSSISYSKDWDNKYNLSLNLNHNQNSVSRLINLTLPSANFNVVTFYPFQKKERIGSEKWYEKLGIGYSGNIQNQLAFYDTAFNFHRLLDTMQWGASHNIPIALSLPSLGPLIITPGVSYEERWYGQKILRQWNDSTKKVDTVINRGFYTARQMSFSLGMNTRIFGTYRFKDKNVMAIRHEVRPSIAFSYKPDMASQYYYNAKIDSTGNTYRFSQFDGNLYGPFSEGAFGGISFGIDNLLEMKVKDKVDTTNKKGRIVKLLDGFGFSSSYNLLTDSFALGNFSLYARSTLFEKINITASANLDPYDVDSRGFRVNRIIWDPKHFKFGRLTGGSVAVSTSFSSKSKDGKDDKTREIPYDPFMTPEEQQRQLQFVRANPSEFTDFNIPWQVSLNYSLSFSNQLKSDLSGFATQTSSNAQFNGDFSLAPKWKVGAMGTYNFDAMKLGQLSMFISRDLHCWQLSINVTPIGTQQSFNISFSPKSGILQDLKINRTRSFISN